MVHHLTIEGLLQVHHLYLSFQVTWVTEVLQVVRQLAIQVTEAHLLVVRHQTKVLQELDLQGIYLVITLSDQEDDK